ncbi:MAG: M48 family peptidase [Deltaproteobacteria bacterium]|nr:MAG: M48 family peptidase [Deltaproteobacteria bacterium]
MPVSMDHIRFRPEQQLIDLLFERFGLEDILAHYEESGEVLPFYEVVLASQLRLTPLLAPRLMGLLDEVRDTLGFEAPVDLFVQADSEINAFALHGMSDKPHVVSLNSGLIERMDDDEIRFVLGHEIGHLAYRHYRSRLLNAALGEDETGETRMPPLLQRRLETWDRQAELSADRCGFTAAGSDIETAVRAFFKMSSGLGPEHLRFDVHAFLHQLEELQKLKRKEVLSTFSHPATPVRVRALQLFGEAGGARASRKALGQADARVTEVARLMELEVTEPLEVHSRDFLVAAGLLVTQAGGQELNRDQADLLLHLILPLSADPEAELERCHNRQAARERLASAIAWLRDNAGPERFGLFAQLAHVVASDGNLSAEDHAEMLVIAEQLAIPEKQAEQILYDALAQYLQAQASMKRPRFSFQR